MNNFRYIKLLLAILFFSLASVTYAQPKKEMQVMAYYESDNINRLDSIDVQKLTHIIFCFGHLDGSKFKIDDAADTAMIHKMVSLKTKNPKLKVLLSLGGWAGCETCSDAFFTSEGREEFARSVKELNDHFKTDGIDLDWEFPTVRLDNDIDKNPVHKTAPEDKKNFTDLVVRLRKTLGKQATITFAAGAFQTFLEKAIEWKEVMKEVDYVNLMTYDLVNGYATTTGHHTGLYSVPQQAESTDSAIQYLINLGIDPQKLILGAAFYARVWENVPNVNNGLYQSGKFKDFIAYSDFPTKLSAKSGFISYWDDKAKAPYMYNAAKKQFATFDDKRSLEIKTRYVADKNLGGIMFWQLLHDTNSGGLLDVIHTIKNSTRDLK
jgi:chitinase